jgi:hypothetical protein
MRRDREDELYLVGRKAYPAAHGGSIIARHWRSTQAISTWHGPIALRLRQDDVETRRSLVDNGTPFSFEIQPGGGPDLMNRDRSVSRRCDGSLPLRSRLGPEFRRLARDAM